MNLKQEARLLELKSILSAISDASFSFSVLNRKCPTSSATDDQKKQLIQSYESIVSQVINVLKNEYENANHTH